MTNNNLSSQSGIRANLLSIINNYYLSLNEIDQRTHNNYEKGKRKSEVFKNSISLIASTLNNYAISSIDSFLSDGDNRIPFFVLSAFAMEAPQRIKLTKKMEESILRFSISSPVRSLREAARIYLFESGTLVATPAIEKAWELTENRELGMMGNSGDHKKWILAQLRTLEDSTFSEDTWYDEESSLFAGQTNRWKLQVGFPFMAVLFRSHPLNSNDLLCVERNNIALADSLKRLIDIGEVERRSVKHGLFSPSEIVFTLANPGFWSGPPF